MYYFAVVAVEEVVVEDGMEMMVVEKLESNAEEEKMEEGEGAMRTV